jgi:hypothetical protein
VGKYGKYEKGIYEDKVEGEEERDGESKALAGL